MDEVVLTRAKGNEESLTGIKAKKGRMISSKQKWRILYYGRKGGKIWKEFPDQDSLVENI